MPSRAFHHKSRHGCVSCKQRRKRCNQQKPKCGGCIKRGDLCMYGEDITYLNMSRFSIPQTPSTPWNTIDPLAKAVISLQLPYIEIGDIELVHHYMVTNSRTFTNMPGLFPLRHVDIANKAPQYPFLLHGILAVSALHLQRTATNTPKSKRLQYAEKASTHQQLALSSYIPQLNSIDSNTCHSIFAFSAILAGLGIGCLFSPEENQDVDAETYINRIVSIFDLLLGTVAVANASSVWIMEVRLEPLLIPIKAMLHCQDGLIELQVQHALEKLSMGIHAAHIIEQEKNPGSAQTDISVIYNSALPELRNVFRCLGKTEPDNFQGVIGWPAFVDSSYVSLLKQRHPAALVVLAYYGVTLHALENAWWLHGVGSEVVRSAVAVIGRKHGKEWQGLLQWPLERISQPLQHTTQMSLMPQPPSLSYEKYIPRFQTPFEAAFDYTYRHDFVEPGVRANRI